MSSRDGRSPRLTVALTTAALLAGSGLIAGCGSPGEPRPSAVATSASPAVATSVACTSARRLFATLLASKEKIADAVRAQATGDTQGRDAAIEEVKATYQALATGLRALGLTVADSAVKQALDAYASAITATVDRVKTATDLALLEDAGSRPAELKQQWSAAVGDFQRLCS